MAAPVADGVQAGRGCSCPENFPDAEDDPVIMAAVACRAAWLVTMNPDLLVLGKLYGIVRASPRAFLSTLVRQL